jgi:hypothetical protein
MTMSLPCTYPNSTNKYPDTNEASIDGSDSEISSTVNSSNIAPSGSKKRYMIIDETKLPSDEAERLLAKRAYNRQCAERARKRSKETVQELLQQVQELHADKVELRRTVAAKEEEIKLLQENYKTLLLTNVTQRINVYPHHDSIGVCFGNDTSALPFKAYSPEQPLPFSTMSLLQQRGNGDGNSPHDVCASLLPTWNRHRFSL